VARPQRRSRWTSTAAAVLAAGVLAGSCSGGTTLFSREPERSVDAFCEQVKVVKDFDAVLASGDVARINGQLDGLQTLQKVAPTEIEAAVTTLVNITEELSRTVATAKDPDVAANEVFAKHQPDIATITAAGEAVQTYSADKCHVALNGTAGTTQGTKVTGTSVPVTSTSLRKT
jgi:hypothetical protein